MATEISSGIKVSVETFYQPSSDQLEPFQYIFAYRITISNDSAFTVQLLKRHWYITDALGDIREVKGEGVIGEQPTIAPGNSYQYTSGCNFFTPIGRMEGSYLMERPKDGYLFYVKIPQFDMVAPFCLN